VIVGFLRSYVDRILNATKAGDLPVEQPTRFEFCHQSQDCPAAQIVVPQSMILRADDVIV
jgi:putative ABC transport system substrate-binding protein